jgi:uncharacterized membrane protein YjjP (DUF1212 family)
MSVAISIAGRASSSPSPHRSEQLLLDVARGLHRGGLPAHRLEETIAALAERLEVHASFYSTPTAIFASFRDEHSLAPRTHILRVEPGDIDLGRQEAVDDIIQKLVAGELDIEAGQQQIQALHDAPPRYPACVTILAFGVTSAAVSVFLRGGIWDIGISGLLGLLVGSVGQIAARVFEMVAALLATLTAATFAALFGASSVFVDVLAGLIVLVPGLTLTIALTELATRNLVSGTARLMAAALTFIQLGFGVGLALALSNAIFGKTAAPAINAVPFWATCVALFFAGCALTVLFRASLRQLPWIVFATTMAFGGAELGRQWLGPELGAFVGAFLIGAVSNARARFFDRPASLTLVPGVLMLVPGSLGFRSVTAFLQHDVLSGIGTAFAMFLVAASLTSGLLFSNIAVRPRHTL